MKLTTEQKTEIIEEAVNSFFASIQTALDPKAEMDLGGWAGITYDGHPDLAELHAIAGRVFAAHVVGIEQADEDLASPSPKPNQPDTMTDTTENASSTNLDELAEAMHLLELAHVDARHALHAAQDAHHAPAETDEQTDKVYAQLEAVGRIRQKAAEKAEAACKILARLAALRD